MRHKLPRWMLVSLSLVLGIATVYQIARGPNLSNAADKTSGPIIPPGGPKPIPLSDDDQPSATDTVRRRTANTTSAFRSVSSPTTVEPKRLTTNMDDARPITASDNPFPTADQSLRNTNETAAPGDPFGLRNNNKPTSEGSSRYGVRPAANETAESGTAPRPFPPFAAATTGSNDPAPPIVGTTTIPNEAPAWSRGATATKEAKDSATITPNKTPFADRGSFGDKPAATEPSGTAAVIRGIPVPKPIPWNDAPVPPAASNSRSFSNSNSTPFGGSDRVPATANNSTTNNSSANASTNPIINNAAKVDLTESLPTASNRTNFAGGSGDGSGRPGSKQLEGSQSPQVTLEKFAPKEIQVGKPAVFEVKVRNVGSVVAQGVEVFDEIPKGTQLLRTVPSASRGSRNELVWSIGALKPGEETKVQVEVMPIAEGEIGSVATVHFRADASVKTISTKPELTLQVGAQRQVLIGDDVTLAIKVSNPGSGVASGIVISERVPNGLQHQAGTELEFDVGDLKPGETRNLELTMKAVTAGAVTNLISAHGEANLKASERTDISIIAPGLKVTMNGPSKRFLERPAIFNFLVQNPGTAPAKDVELTTYLPKGLKFVKTNNSGQYDPRRHCVTWNLEELPASETGVVQMTALPIEEGEQKLRIEGKAQQGLTDSSEAKVIVDGVAAVLFEVADLADPIEVGGETTYEVRVTNQGSKAANNIRITALLPSELKPLSAEGPSRHTIEGTKVTFEPLPRLSPKADTIFRIRAQGVRPGDARVKVQLMADELSQPVTKEESTHIYADE